MSSIACRRSRERGGGSSDGRGPMWSTCPLAVTWRLLSLDKAHRLAVRSDRPSVCVHDPFSARLRRTLPLLALLHVFLLSRHTTRLSHQTNRSRGPIMDGAHRGTLSLSLEGGHKTSRTRRHRRLARRGGLHRSLCASLRPLLTPASHSASACRPSSQSISLACSRHRSPLRLLLLPGTLPAKHRVRQQRIQRALVRSQSGEDEHTSDGY